MADSSALDALLDDALAGFKPATDQPAARRQPAPPPTAAATPAGDAAAGASSSQGNEQGLALRLSPLPKAPADAGSSAAGGAIGIAAADSSTDGAGAAGGSATAPSLTFDPLGQRPKPAQARPDGGAGSSGGSGAGGGRGPALPPRPAPRAARAAGGAGPPPGLPEGLAEELGELPEGLSRLLEELAKVDLDAFAAGAGSGTAGPGGAPAAQPPPPPRGQQRAPGAQTAAAAAAEGQRDLGVTLRALADQAPSFGEGGAGDVPDSALRDLAQQLQALAGVLGGPEAAAAAAAGGDAAGGGGGPPPEMAALVDSLMQQLLSKEVLYQPMKDIGGRYQPWLEANRERLSAEELERYTGQLGYIRRICELYESDPGDYQQLVSLVQEMQALGQPPQEIVDELAPGGLKLGPDGLPDLGGIGGADCCIQ